MLFVTLLFIFNTKKSLDLNSNTLGCTELTNQLVKENIMYDNLYVANKCVFMKDVVFYSCKCNPQTYGGGAIYLQQAREFSYSFYCFSCSFVECIARTNIDLGGVGGAVFFEGNTSIVARCCGSRCVATNAGMFLYLHARHNNPNYLNDTSCFRCPVNEKIAENAPVYLEDAKIRVNDLNSSCNEVSNLGDVFYSLKTIKLNRCTFYKIKADCAMNLVGFNETSVTSCCNFVENSCGEMVVMYEVYEFKRHSMEKCVWIKNTGKYAVGDAKEYELTLIDCVFDQDYKKFGSLTLINLVIVNNPKLNAMSYFITKFCAPNINSEKIKLKFWQ